MTCHVAEANRRLQRAAVKLLRMLPRMLPITPFPMTHSRRRLALIALAGAAFTLPALSRSQPANPTCPPTAQVPTAEQVQAQMRVARDRGFLWRVQKDGRSSYLYGTIHVAKMEWMFPGPQVLAALRASDVVAVELDLLDPAMVATLQTAMAPKPEPALPAALDARLRAQVTLACLPAALLDALSPVMAAATLVVMSARREGLDPSYGIDPVVSAMGRRLDKPVVSLETAEMQMKLLQGETPQDAQDSVAQILDELEADRARPMLLRLSRMWADSRLDELDTYAQWCDCLKTALEREFMKRALDDRNGPLAERIAALHSGGQAVFAAVGSLHMTGPQGLPSLLRQRGYQVDVVPFAR